MARSSFSFIRTSSYIIRLAIILVIFFAPLITAFLNLSSSTLRSLPRPASTFGLTGSQSILAPILVPRVSGTEGNEQVRSFFAQFFSSNLPKWAISYQNSTSTTPATGSRQVPFINFIGKRAPPWAEEGEISYLTLVAHYDSKLTPPGFIGATDSAAPCAMLLHVVKALDTALTKKWESMSAAGVDGSDPDTNRGLQVLLLDGEEAFKSWTHTDSTYGARSLAAEWEVTPHQALSTYKNPLDSIDLFVLLDLLGASDPKVPSYFITTHWAYKKIADTEKRLREDGLFWSSPNHHRKKSRRKEDGKVEARQTDEPSWFFETGKTDTDRWMGGLIGDDHEPFLARGVEVLHVIPTPFPRVWHHMDDDGTHLDMDTTEDWAVLVTAFAAEWMELEGFLEGTDKDKRDTDWSDEDGRDKETRLAAPAVRVRDEL